MADLAAFDPAKERPLVDAETTCFAEINGHDICILPRGHDGEHEYWDEANVDVLPKALGH